MRLGGRIRMKTILIVANQTLSSDELVAAAMARKAAGACQFRVIVPATPLSKQERALRNSEHPGAVFGESGPVAVARMRLSKGLSRLEEFGIVATGDVGDPDPFTAIRTACEHWMIDEVIISTLPHRMSHWMAADLPHRVRRRLGLKVTHVETGETLDPLAHPRTRATALGSMLQRLVP
jgi:hypothetical protein